MSLATNKFFIHLYMLFQHPRYNLFLTFVLFCGASLVAKFLLELMVGIYARLLRPGKNLKKLGKWAVVTGATDGIGLAMSEEMAKKGMNIVLISRSLDKLKSCADDMSKKYPKAEVKTLDIDFGKFDDKQRKRVASVFSAIADDGIAVLVNNVGVSYPFTKYFHELDGEKINNIKLGQLLLLLSILLFLSLLL